MEISICNENQLWKTSQQGTFFLAAPRLIWSIGCPRSLHSVISFRLWSISYTINMINARQSKVGEARRWWGEEERGAPGCHAVCLMKQKSNSVRLKATDEAVYSPWQMQMMWLHFPQHKWGVGVEGPAAWDHTIPSGAHRKFAQGKHIRGWEQGRWEGRTGVCLNNQC